MTRIDKACYERGCACYDDRVDSDAVEVVLAQPEQEPVAWMDADGNVSDNNDHKCFPIPLYTTPPQRTEQVPAPGYCKHCKQYTIEEPLPPKRTEQEPVAWAKRGAEWLLGLPDTPLEYPYFTNGVFKGDCQELAELLQSITTPPQRTEQEPVIDKSVAIRIATVLGWTPPRPWVGLTDEEIEAVPLRQPNGYAGFARAIEAKLKQKNGYAEEKNT